MPTIKLESPLALSGEQRKAYSTLLVTKSSARILEGRSPLNIQDAKLHLLGAYDGNQLLGCCAFSDYEVLSVADLLYIAVLEEHRGKGIATDILRELALYLKRNNLHTCYARYLKEEPFSTTIEHLFAKLGWSTPALENETYYIEVAKFHPPWLYKEYSLPDGCEIFPWVELTDLDREKIKHMEMQGLVPNAISPFKTKYAFEPLNSLGLRYKGEVKAWMVNHRIKKDLIRFSSLFVHPDLRTTSSFFLLGRQAIQIQQNSSVPWACCIINPSAVFASWRRFAQGFLCPCAGKVEHLYLSCLFINN